MGREREGYTEGQEKSLGHDGHIHSLDCCDGFTNVDKT